jgi:hypothetical protein
VTARIRRRSESLPAIEPPSDPEATATPVEMPSTEAAPPAHSDEPVAVIHPFPDMTQAAPAKPQPAYRQQVARSRRQNDRQLNLF